MDPAAKTEAKYPTLYGLLTVARRRDLEAELLEILAQELGRYRVVLGDQDPRLGEDDELVLGEEVDGAKRSRGGLGRRSRGDTVAVQQILRRQHSVGCQHRGDFFGIKDGLAHVDEMQESVRSDGLVELGDRDRG